MIYTEGLLLEITVEKVNGIKAPDIIIRNEKRMLQESVDALFEMDDVVSDNWGKKGLEILSDMLKEKVVLGRIFW